MTADLFPIDIAKEIVQRVPKASILDMDWLLDAWKEYVEPDLDTSCGMCKERVFKNFKELQGALLLRIQQRALLDQL